jgi:cysteine desulfurase/selenocysteine lyase
VLDEAGVEVRVGHHCAWPLHRKFAVAATTRATFYIYNGLSDIDALADAIVSAQRFFKVI